MTQATPVVRARDLERLLEVAEQTRVGRGSVVFLSGPTGSGKSLLLKSFALACADAPPDVESALCYETSAGNPLGPFGEVLRALTNRDRRGAKAKRVLEIVKQVAPPLVELIPVIGKLAALGVKTASEVGIYALGGEHEAQQTQLASDVAAALQRIADDEPLVVVIDDAHWIDAPSTEVIARVTQAAEDHALALVIAYDATLVDDRHPLARVRSTAIARRGVRDIELGDLTRDEVEALLRDRYGCVPGQRLSDWLHDLTEGSPLFVEQYLASLETQGVLRRDDGRWTLDGAIGGQPGAWELRGALAGAHTPDTLLELLRPRVADLAPEERSLLETGAVQGRRFLSSVLVKLLDREEDEILERLAEIARQRRMIASENVEDWWTDRSALYTFDPGVLQELLYDDRYAENPYERRRRHRAVAEALAALVADDDPPPRHALLEIARHYDAASEPLQAATLLVDVAESTFAEGADRETARIAARAVDLLREVPAKELETPDAQRLLARAILLLLLGGEPSWRADPSHADGERLLALADEAERAAAATGDLKLRANARFATAFVRIAYRGLEEAIAAYREALELAREAGDRVAEFAILIDFGHQLDSVDLKAGRDVLEEAHELLTGGGLDRELTDAQRAIEAARLDMSVGVAEFDLGDYGEALERLVRASQALRATRRRDDAAWTLAFLAQVYTAIGLYESAEATLRDAIALFVDHPASLHVRGYLKALLGHVCLAWGRPKEARELLVGARSETIDSGYRAVIPLVEAYWAELLLAEGTPDALHEAETALAAMETWGWARSEIARASLRARVALAQGRVDDAVRLSTQAVTKLDECGGHVTATRSEEILFTHARILDAAGSPDASRYHAEAARVARGKADSLRDPAQKASFLEVDLSREILESA